MGWLLRQSNIREKLTKYLRRRARPTQTLWKGLTAKKLIITTNFASLERISSSCHVAQHLFSSFLPQSWPS